MPSRLPSSTTICSMPSCHLPARASRSALARSRAHIISSAQPSSAVDAFEPPPGVVEIGMPRSAAALSSRLAARAPVSTMNLRLGSFSISARGKAVRSRSRPRIWNGASFCAASSTDLKASWNTVISTPRFFSRSQSAMRMATF